MLLLYIHTKLIHLSQIHKRPHHEKCSRDAKISAIQKPTGLLSLKKSESIKGTD